jgi:hypothetical protein
MFLLIISGGKFADVLLVFFNSSCFINVCLCNQQSMIKLSPHAKAEERLSGTTMNY